MNSIDGQPGVPWYAYAIARHESGAGALNRHYNQFNELGTGSVELEGTPNWGPPRGWGIFQTDEASRQPITPAVLWNWQENVRLGVFLATEFRAWADRHMQRERGVAQQMTGQNQPVPDEQVTPNCLFSDAGGHPIEDAVGIQRFNRTWRRPYVHWDRLNLTWVFDRVTTWQSRTWRYVEHVCNEVGQQP
jgi:hypothetical protein